MADLDYAGVSRFWSKARPSILGPYMMDGFGFPGGAGRFRFQGESRIVSRLIGKLDGGGGALDLGCGVGYWAEYFAGHFAKVVAVEAAADRGVRAAYRVDARAVPHALVDPRPDEVGHRRRHGERRARSGLAGSSRHIDHCSGFFRRLSGFLRLGRDPVGQPEHTGSVYRKQLNTPFLTFHEGDD